MTTQTASTELTLDQLDDVNGGAWYNPYDWFEAIVDTYYDAKEAGDNRRAKQWYAAKTGNTDGKM